MSEQVQEAQQEQTNVVELHPEGEPAEAKPVHVRIKELEDELDALERAQMRTVVGELPLQKEALASIAKERAALRWPRIQREIETHIKQVAFSGERVAFLDPKSEAYNEKIIKWLTGEGLKAKIVRLGTGNGFRIEASW